MIMPPIVCDANILLDIEAGDLIAEMFNLAYRFIIPEVIFCEELEEPSDYLSIYGAVLGTLGRNEINRLTQLAQKYSQPSRNDLFALVLTESKDCILLTGDKQLKLAAEKENIIVHGTIWLIEQLIQQNKITVQNANSTYKKMLNKGRRLPPMNFNADKYHK